MGYSVRPPSPSPFRLLTSIAATHPSPLTATNVDLALMLLALLISEFFSLHAWSSSFHPPSQRPTLPCALHARVQPPKPSTMLGSHADVMTRPPSTSTLITRHPIPWQSTVATGTDTAGKCSAAQFDKHMHLTVRPGYKQRIRTTSRSHLSTFLGVQGKREGQKDIIYWEP